MPTLKELAQPGKEALLAYVAEMLMEFAAQKARGTELLAEDAALKARLEQRALDAMQRAAPFSKERGEARPRRPGRKPGQGDFTLCTLPAPDQLTAPSVEVRLAETDCPCCRQAAGNERRARSLLAEVTRHSRPRRLAAGDSLRLLDEFGRHHARGNLLRFLEEPRVQPTNNASDRGFRLAVIQRNVTQCSNDLRGASSFEAFACVLNAAMRQGDVAERLTKLLRRAGPRKCTDLTSRGEHSHPLVPQFEVAWLLPGRQAE